MRLSVKRISAVVLMMAASFLVAGLLGEILIRVTIKDQIVLFPRYHSDVDYGPYRIRRFRPNSSFTHTSIDGEWRFDINNRGFRNDSDYEYEKPEATLRVLSLGDSHTAGYEVSQNATYSAVLEALLTDTGIDAEVLNTGISGFGTAEQLVFLQNEGLRYAPDIVVVGFYANDLQDNVKSGLYSLKDGRLHVEKTVHLPGVRIQNTLNNFAIIRWLSQNSYFFSFAFNAAYELAKTILTNSAKEDAITEYAIPVGDFTDYEYSLAKALVAEISRVCKENNIKLIIMDIPVPTDNYRIEPSITDELATSFAQNSDALIDSPSALSSLMDRNLPAHVEHGHRHMSRHSHRLMAEAIAVEISELLTIDETSKGP